MIYVRCGQNLITVVQICEGNVASVFSITDLIICFLQLSTFRVEATYLSLPINIISVSSHFKRLCCETVNSQLNSFSGLFSNSLFKKKSFIFVAPQCC